MPPNSQNGQKRLLPFKIGRELIVDRRTVKVSFDERKPIRAIPYQASRRKEIEAV